MALGAPKGVVLRAVLLEGAMMTLIGMVGGSWRLTPYRIVWSLGEVAGRIGSGAMRTVGTAFRRDIRRFSTVGRPKRRACFYSKRSLSSAAACRQRDLVPGSFASPFSRPKSWIIPS
jgi:hypothetical protein